jgi:hypothetical protein
MRRRTLLLALAVVSVALLASCHGRDWDNECDLIVSNRSDCDLYVYVDGWEAAKVHNDSSRTIDDIGDGRHILEAKDEDGELIERRSIDLDDGEDYYWRLDDC